MKTLYTTLLLCAGSLIVQAQESKPAEKQDDIKNIKQAKAFEAKMLNSNQENKAKVKTYQLASEEGLDSKEKTQTFVRKNNNVKLLPNTTTMEEVLATIPGRKK